MHHEQDIRKMGGLKKYLPITWITSLIGSLALIGFPGMAGFFSKDAIIEAVHHSHVAGAHFAYACVLIGVFVTALYSFRMYFLVFHGKERMDHHTQEHLHETPAVVTGPLIALAIPSVLSGLILVGPMLFRDYFGEAIFVLPEHNVLEKIGEEFHGWFWMIVHGLTATPTWLAFSGVATAYYCYLLKPEIPARIAEQFQWLYQLLLRKYGFDEMNQFLFAGGARNAGDLLNRYGDQGVIDGLAVNGSARLVGYVAGVVRQVQSGYLYHYAFAMILGLLLMLGLFVYHLA
jgi:NADH-quinone oxidoreductase subunit L